MSAIRASVVIPVYNEEALLHELHAAGRPLYFLSNMPEPYARHLEATHDFLGLFRDGVFSARVQLMKPQPEIFHAAAQRFGQRDEVHGAEVIGHHLELRGGAEVAGVEDPPAHRLEQRQDLVEALARAAGEDRDIAGIGAVAAARNRAFHEHRATRFNQRAKANNLFIVGRAHFHPDLAGAHNLKEAIFAFSHSGTAAKVLRPRIGL